MMIELKEGEIPVIRQKGDVAIIAITKHGVQLARQLHQRFSHADLYYMSKFSHGDEGQKSIQMFSGSVRLLFPALWSRYKGIILIVSLGAVVRMIAPLLKDKKTDPGVVVIDDKGENAISVLSGHLGGANELTREVAAVIDAKPIITTASDVQKTIPVDLLGRRFGWEWEDESEDKLTSVSASVVNEEQVAIIQESGERNWWLYDSALPDHFQVYSSVNEAMKNHPQAALVITHRMLDKEEQPILKNGVLYRPKVIVLGMGCNRNTPLEEIESVVHATLDDLGLSIRSVKAVASIDLKKDEEGLLALCRKYGWEFVTYSPEQLNRIPLKEPSETVFRYTGAYGVSEPAAKLYGNTNQLLINKKKSGNVTISVGIMNELD